MVEQGKKLKNNKLLLIVFVVTIVFLEYFYWLYSSKKNTRYPLGTEVLYTYEVPIQPRILFHGSSNQDIEILEPRAIATRSKQEGNVIFATPHIGYAAVFMSSHHKDRGFSIEMQSFDHGPVCCVCNHKENFMKHDKGGAIYLLPSDTFYYDLGFVGLSRKEWFSKAYTEDFGDLREWVSRDSVKPLYKIEFKSVLEAMLDLGVQVYFVDEDTFEEVRAVMKNRKDPIKRRKLFMNLVSENKKLNKNYKPLFDYATL